MLRDLETATTSGGLPVCVKVGRLDGKIANVQAEYEDCAKIARAHGIPLKQVLRQALDAYFASNQEWPYVRILHSKTFLPADACTPPLMSSITKFSDLKYIRLKGDIILDSITPEWTIRILSYHLRHISNTRLYLHMTYDIPGLLKHQHSNLTLTLIILENSWDHDFELKNVELAFCRSDNS